MNLDVISMNSLVRECRACTQPCRRAANDLTDMIKIRDAAARFIDRFGTRAGEEAARRADELLDAGDVQARVRGQLIDREIDEIFRNLSPVADGVPQ